MIEMWLDIVNNRLRCVLKCYCLVDVMFVMLWVWKFIFELKDLFVFMEFEFDFYVFVMIMFGCEVKFSRFYFIVEGNLYKFSFGVFFDCNFRGGLVYFYYEFWVGDEIIMFLGDNFGV